MIISFSFPINIGELSVERHKQQSIQFKELEVTLRKSTINKIMLQQKEDTIVKKKNEKKSKDLKKKDQNLQDFD